jgi:2-aminoethylphosphonate-pyruvate transaminase
VPPRQLLLNPGPVTLSPGVRDALAAGDACHREPAFAALTREVLTGLGTVYDGAADYDAVLLACSGTGAVEAMLASLAPADSRTLVLSNGVYGERMAAMLAAHGRPHEQLAGDWLAPLDLGALEARLQADPGITHVATVHHETTTGRLNDLAAVGALCRRLDRRLLLDAVSSFGAEEIRFDDWALAGLAATANKCLHAPPGASFVLAERAALEASAPAAGSVYLDLRRYHGPQQESGYSPFTPAVNTVAALATALSELRAGGGWRGRRETYRSRSRRVAEMLGRLGVEPLLAADAGSCVLTSWRLPTGWSYRRLHDALAADDIIIYAGQGPLGPEVFRIACMGEIAAAELDRLEAALTALLAPAGGAA